MFLREGMEHNKFDYSNDIIQPIKYFLQYHGLDRHILNSKDKPKRYFDKRTITTNNLSSKSQYYTNFDEKLRPSLPEIDSNGNYLPFKF